MALGVTAQTVETFDAFAKIAGSPISVYQWYQSWEGSPSFDAARATAADSRGALPLLTWEPWVAGGGVEQPTYSLDQIANGAHDAYVRSFARQIRDWGGLVGLRFLHELNARHYPWGAGVNGNTPAEAVAAWHHVREVFESEGARNIVWVWCVNVSGPDTATFKSVYPGDQAVDWVAIDGYNGGTVLPWGGWRSPRELFGDSISKLKDLSDKPLVITEVASVEQGGDKAVWISDLFALAVESRIRLLVWFEFNKEADWRVRSSPAAADAFHREATVPGRLGPPPLQEVKAGR
jgi:hypothetical protein